MINVEKKIVNPDALKRAIERFREKGIILPTFAQMKNPEIIPDKIKNRLKNISLWDLNPLNLFRITWHNEPKEKGGLFGKVNYLELPKSLTGVDARIVLLIGKWFPTGAHKVGAAYSCLAPRIVTGEFDPTYHKAVWPSSGNFCRGGAFISHLMGVTAVAILPQEMSKERFDWLREIGAEIIATQTSEVNMKAIYNECWNIRRNKKDHIIFNQFDEFGNAVWHYNITGYAMQEVYNELKTEKSNFAGFACAIGSSGTIAAGDYLRLIYPHIKVAASEALQSSTLLMNGFGLHRIEGISDNHVQWIHNVKNTNIVIGIDDEDCMRIFRLFNEKDGINYLVNNGVHKEIVENLNLLGISSISNMLTAIKMAKYYEMTSDDIIMTIATDSAEMYQSRLIELKQKHGNYNPIQAAKDYEKCILGAKTDNMRELTYYDQKMIHNLKYFTWVEQQDKEIEDLNQLWYDRNIWHKIFNQTEALDKLINQFNEETGMINKL